MTPDCAVIGHVDAPALHCMTLNVRRPVPHLRRDHPDAWPRRAPAIATLARSEAPHLLAVQEAVPEQVQHLRTAMGARWRAVVSARGSSGAGEGVGFFVDEDRLRVGDTTTIALARHPDRIGSRDWGAPFPRIAVLAEIEDLATSVRFLAVATHVDPVSPLAQVRSARLLGTMVADAGLPAVVLADWNAGERSASARILTSSGLLDTWDLVPDGSRPPTVGTYANYRTPKQDGRRLDRILVTGGRVTVDRVAISPRRPDGVWPSDHLPVHAVIRWEAP